MNKKIKEIIEKVVPIIGFLAQGTVLIAVSFLFYLYLTKFMDSGWSFVVVFFTIVAMFIALSFADDYKEKYFPKRKKKWRKKCQ